MNCCPGIGRLRLQHSPLKRRDHTRQQGSPRHHHYSGREGPRRRRRLAAGRCQRNGDRRRRRLVYGVGEDGVQAFTGFGIENLIELVRMYKESPGLLKRWPLE